MANFELNDLDLAKVSGGKLDEATKEWIERNMDKIKELAGPYYSNYIGAVMMALENDPNEISIDTIKEKLAGLGLDVSGLE